MRVRATRSFTGLINMSKNEERDITNEKILKDLLECGYVVSVEKAQVEETKEQQPAEIPAEEIQEPVVTEENAVPRKTVKGKK